MRDTESGSSIHTSLPEEIIVGLPHTPGASAHKVSAKQEAAKQHGFVQRIVNFFVRLFKHASQPTDRIASDRAAAALAAHMQPPVAFKGDTTNTLATPMGTYAGKPVEQALRKRAEQQFQTMDVTRATMN